MLVSPALQRGEMCRKFITESRRDGVSGDSGGNQYPYRWRNANRREL